MTPDSPPFDWHELKLSAVWDSEVSQSLARDAWKEYDAMPKSTVIYNSAHGTLDRFRLPQPVRVIYERIWWEMIADIDSDIRAQDDCAKVIQGTMRLDEWRLKWRQA